jgi:hypothetical protein
MVTAGKLLNRALTAELGYKPDPRHRISADSRCPDCGRPIKLVFDAKIAGAFPALMGLDQMVVCNNCADFRTALREAQEAMDGVVAILRKRGLSITAKTKLKTEIQSGIDQMNAELRPIVEAVTSRLIRILARRTGKAQSDFRGWATQFLNIWECLRTYDGEELVRVEHDDQTWKRLRSLRATYGVFLKHHGKPRTGPTQPGREPEMVEP